jgi:hypothetical protein
MSTTAVTEWLEHFSGVSRFDGGAMRPRFRNHFSTEHCQFHQRPIQLPFAQCRCNYYNNQLANAQ